jgi:ribonucleoside-triphosphate reductase (formate)
MTPRIHILPSAKGDFTYEAAADATDIALQVSTVSAEEINLWDKQKIVDSIILEAQAPPDLALEIADSVERTLIATGQTRVTTSLIRELVDLQLMERGLSHMLEKHSRLGLPMFDVENIITQANKENSNTTHNPESINLTIAETVLKQYALQRIFSEDIARAHYEGDIHLHDLGFCVRPYCGGHSLEYVKKYGLRLPNITSTSSPARHPDVLIGHMVKMASTLQSYYAGAIGWEAVNVFFAPFLVDLPYSRIKQLAEMLIFEFNQLAGARGSQVVFTDFNLYWNVPRHLKDAPAIGPGGEPTGKKYSDYEEEAKRFLTALFEVYREGDAMGKTFVFPKPLLHINKDFFATEGWQEFLDLACDVASRQGITYFVFDRGDEITVSQCCRLKLRLDEEDLKQALTPEKMRFTALQNITINLPRLAYRAHGSDEMLLSELEKTLEMVARAHLQKKKFITSLMGLDRDGPVSLLTMEHDGEPYLRLDRLTYLVGLLGLNEMVQHHTGEQLHQSSAALRFGLKVVAHMSLVCEQLSEKCGINMVLEESPAESSGYRLAKLDMKYFGKQAGAVVKGDVDSDNYYYTNSVHIATDASVDYVQRVKKQSLFHPLIKAGAIVHVWLGEHQPPASSIRKFVEKTFQETDAAQIAFSPEFTVCNSCSRTSRGLSEECPLCGSTDTYGITRIVGYFSKVSTWNKGKLGELEERKRTGLIGGKQDGAEGILEGGLS